MPNFKLDKHSKGSVSSKATNEDSTESLYIRSGESQNHGRSAAVLENAQTRSLESTSTINSSAPTVGADEAIGSSDVWSKAYREAVASLGESINTAILTGESVEKLFEQLEKIEKGATQESVFLKGVRYLRSLQVPLEEFKLALDLATQLTSIEPTTATVFGVIKSVAAVSSHRRTFISRVTFWVEISRLT